MHIRPGTRAKLSPPSELRARNPARMSALFQELLPAGIATAELSGPGDPSTLWPAERKYVGTAVANTPGRHASGPPSDHSGAGRPADDDVIADSGSTTVQLTTTSLTYQPF